MVKFLALICCLEFVSSARAMCPADSLKTHEPSSLRLLFPNGVELDLVFGKLENDRLSGSYLAVGSINPRETAQEASVRYHSRYVFPLTNFELTQDRRRIFFRDPDASINMDVELKDPFRFGRVQVLRMNIESSNRWIAQNVPPTIRPDGFTLLRWGPQRDLEYTAKETMAKLLFDILPEQSKIVAPEAENLVRVIASTPYARKNMDFEVKQYRGLIVFRVGIGNTAKYNAFSTFSTPVEFFDLISGLKALGLMRQHSIFARAASLRPSVQQ